jgi:O-antigen biosynthesis protein WbqP
MKRIIDLLLWLLFFLLFAVPMLLIAVTVRLSSKGPCLYWSDRIGKNGKTFKMPKFRSMYIETPLLATHLLHKPDSYITPIGGFLSRTSLDELPQLFSILKGDMSFIGPRPALYNQYDLIALRKEKFVDRLIPGITGLAQVNGRDSLTISDKVKLDEEYLNCRSFLLDIKIFWLTFLKVVKRDDVSH